MGLLLWERDREERRVGPQQVLMITAFRQAHITDDHLHLFLSAQQCPLVAVPLVYSCLPTSSRICCKKARYSSSISYHPSL